MRSPLTAILNAAGPLRSGTITPRSGRAAAFTQEAGRLSQRIHNLLDLSRLEAGAASHSVTGATCREVILSAVEELPLPEETFHLQPGGGPAPDQGRLLLSFSARS